MANDVLSRAALAFDATAARFDERFGAWASVAAQRAAVRAHLARAFAPGARVLEIGGGTGEDARWLGERGRNVLLTDASPSMVHIAARKLDGLGLPAPRVATAECVDDAVADEQAPFDGAFSNFAALNCVARLDPVGRALSRVVRPGGRVVLVLFGVHAPGEWIVQLARGNGRAAFRRRSCGPVPARLGGRAFTVRYHRRADIQRALSPWFRLRACRGIGIFVPPSAAEPWISRYPRLVAALAAADRLVSAPLASAGDHVLYDFVRTEAA